MRDAEGNPWGEEVVYIDFLADEGFSAAGKCTRDGTKTDHLRMQLPFGK